MINRKFWNSISFFINELENDEINWVLTGTYRLYLENDLIIHPKDIDILTDKEGIELIKMKFEKFIKSEFRLRTSDSIKSHFGKLRINEVDFDVMSEVYNKVNSNWMQIPRLEVDEFIYILHKKIPVFSLEREKEIAKILNQEMKNQVIENIIKKKKALHNL